MSAALTTIDQALQAAGVGRFQRRLFVIFGLVWAADAMQVLSIGFSAPSIAATFDRTIPQALQTGTMFFTGMLAGAFVFGWLADRIGRRPVLMIAILIDAAFGIASAFSTSFEMLLALRLLTGIGVGGTLPVDYTLMAEFLPSRRRGHWLVMLESFWALGTIVLAILAYVAVSYGSAAWQVIFFVTGIPAIIGVVLRFYVPESPLFLSRNGRVGEARAVLQRVADVNRTGASVGELQPGDRARPGIVALFSPLLRQRTTAMLVAWALISVSYYGVFVYLPVRLAGEGFGFMRGQLFLIVLAIVQLPGFALSAYGVERWGRKPTLIGFTLLSAAGCLLFSLGTDPILVVGSTLLMSFSLLGTWGAMYAYTPEIYPTGLRASGMGTAGAVARVGGLLAPSIVAPVMATHFTLSLVLISGMLVISAVSVGFVDLESRARVLD